MRILFLFLFSASFLHSSLENNDSKKPLLKALSKEKPYRKRIFAFNLVISFFVFLSCCCIFCLLFLMFGVKFLSGFFNFSSSNDLFKCLLGEYYSYISSAIGTFLFLGIVFTSFFIAFLIYIKNQVNNFAKYKKDESLY